MAAPSLYLAALLTACSVCDVTGSAILFQSSSSSIKPLVSTNLTLTCSLADTAPVGPAVGKRSAPRRPSLGVAADVITGGLRRAETSFDDPSTPRTVTHTDENMAFVTGIVISRDGSDVATVTEHFPAAAVGGASGFRVSGELPGTSGSKGLLTLVWPHPTAADGGNYVCDVTAQNLHGRSFQFQQTLNVAEEEVSLTDLVGYLQVVQKDREQLQATVADQRTSIDNLTNTVATLLQKARVEPDVFFTAYLSSTQTISTDGVVKFDHVLTNQGAAYDESTGEFTCPYAGFYNFQLHAYSSSANAFLMIKRNDQDVVGVVCYDGTEDGASNSATVRLDKGDTVKVVGTRQSVVIGGTWNRSTFSGQLVALA